MSDVPKYEELVERFRRKVAGIPVECHEAVMLWLMAKRVQEARIAAENQLRQVVEVGKKVFWSGDLPEAVRSVMVAGDVRYFEALRRQENALVRACEKSFKRTEWYNTVAVPAAEGEGMGPLLAGEFLWCIGTPSRFASFGKLVRYAGLDVQDGRAPKRRKGQRVTWNPQLRTALFKLTEVWNRMPQSVWRARWDAWKRVYRERFPERETYVDEDGKERARYNDGHLHNMARRKVQREFLRALYLLWQEYEARTGGADRVSAVSSLAEVV